MNLFRRVDPGLIVVLLICLLVVWPFVSRPDMPQNTDAELHIFRTAELSQLMRDGIVYPRWSPNFYFGYGYPIFNYYAPLTYYLGAGLMLLLGIDAVMAVKLVFVLGLFGAGLGMVAFVGRSWGKRAAIVAAALYVLAPYVQYVDPQARGVLAETFSFAVFPWVMWAFASLWQEKKLRYLPLGAILLAMLICSHNLMGAVFAALLAAWMGWQLVAGRLFSAGQDDDDRRGWFWLPAGLMLGCALAAFFLLPVGLERNAVQLGNLISDGGHYDYHTHFLTAGELLRATPLLDLGATEPCYAFNVGLVQWSLALLGVGLMFWPRRRSLSDRWQQERAQSILFGGLAVGLLFLLLPISAPIWERVPLMPFLQFPWRLLGPLAACLAIVGGYAVASIENIIGDRRADWLVAALLGVTLLLGLPLSYPPEWPADFGSTDAWAIIQRELAGRWLGTTSAGDFVPVGVIVLPKPSQQLLAAYQDGQPVDRVNHATVPAGSTVTPLDMQPLRWTYQIEGEKFFIFRLFHFYFPGWTATLDGQPVPIKPAKPDGFITVEMPPGRHELVVAFEDTMVRKVAWSISGLALVICVVIWLAGGERTKGAAGHRYAAPSRLLLLVPLAVLLFKVTLADPLGWFRLESEGIMPARVEHPVYLKVGEDIALIGYDWKDASAGDTIELTLYWRALQPISTNYQVFVHLRDQTGAVVVQSDKLNPGDFPTSRWPLEKYVRDLHRIQLPDDLDGQYQLAVGLWLMAEGKRLPVRDADGSVIGDSLLLETLNY